MCVWVGDFAVIDIVEPRILRQRFPFVCLVVVNKV